MGFFKLVTMLAILSTKGSALCCKLANEEVAVVPFCENFYRTGRNIVIASDSVPENQKVECKCDVNVAGTQRLTATYDSPEYINCGVELQIGNRLYSCEDAYSIIDIEPQFEIIYRKTITRENPDTCIMLEAEPLSSVINVYCKKNEPSASLTPSTREIVTNYTSPSRSDGTSLFHRNDTTTQRIGTDTNMYNITENTIPGSDSSTNTHDKTLTIPETSETYSTIHFTTEKTTPRSTPITTITSTSIGNSTETTTQSSETSTSNHDLNVTSTNIFNITEMTPSSKANTHAYNKTVTAPPRSGSSTSMYSKSQTTPYSSDTSKTTSNTNKETVLTLPTVTPASPFANLTNTSLSASSTSSLPSSTQARNSSTVSDSPMTISNFIDTTTKSSLTSTNTSSTGMTSQAPTINLSSTLFDTVKQLSSSTFATNEEEYNVTRPDTGHSREDQQLKTVVIISSVTGCVLLLVIAVSLSILIYRKRAARTKKTFNTETEIRQSYIDAFGSGEVNDDGVFLNTALSVAHVNEPSKKLYSIPPQPERDISGQSHASFTGRSFENPVDEFHSLKIPPSFYDRTESPGSLTVTHNPNLKLDGIKDQTFATHIEQYQLSKSQHALRGSDIDYTNYDRLENRKPNAPDRGSIEQWTHYDHIGNNLHDCQDSDSPDSDGWVGNDITRKVYSAGPTADQEPWQSVSNDKQRSTFPSVSKGYNDMYAIVRKPKEMHLEKRTAKLVTFKGYDDYDEEEDEIKPKGILKNRNTEMRPIDFIVENENEDTFQRLRIPRAKLADDYEYSTVQKVNRSDEEKALQFH